MTHPQTRTFYAERAPILGWLAFVAVYVLVLMLAADDAALILNNAVWTLAPLAAAYSAWQTSRDTALSALQRRGWQLVAWSCASWCAGQICWAYYVFVLPEVPSFPRLNTFFYWVYAALLLRALGWLSDSAARAPFTFQHLGNLGLIGCCMAATLVIIFWEPTVNARSPASVIGVLLHCTFMSMPFFAALYYLWTQRWLASWKPMLLIAVGTAIYGLGNFVYVHALILQTYTPADWVNTSWALTFIAYGVAAQLRRLPLANEGGVEVAGRRTQQLEATIPALLIILMVGVGMLAADQLSVRVLIVVALLLILFAFILGVREAWMQRESQRLTRELRAMNERLRATNRELMESEARVRDLHGHLEDRVAERTRELQRAYEELEGFAYAVAHDLKAPLRAIDGFGHLLEEAVSERGDPRSRSYVERIRRSAVKMAKLIEDLLAYSRIERRPFTAESIDLDALITTQVAEQAQDIERRQVDVRVGISALRIRADREALALVLQNLLQNALKFTANVHAPRIDIRSSVADGIVRIDVVDNGIGFDMQYHDQIFKLFHRLHRDEQYEGTGIGLALVRKALERMNGRVRAHSEEGHGARFSVELPYAPA